MARRLSEGDRQPANPVRQDIGGRGDVDPGLSILAHHQKGSDGGPDLRTLGRLMEAFSPVRDDAGGRRAGGGGGQAHQDADAGNGGGIRGGDDGGVMTAIGDTVKDAALTCYRRLDKLTVPNSPMYRTDIGKKLAKQLPQ